MVKVENRNYYIEMYMDERMSILTYYGETNNRVKMIVDAY